MSSLVPLQSGCGLFLGKVGKLKGRWELDNRFAIFTHPLHMWAWFGSVCQCTLPSLFTRTTGTTPTARATISQDQHFQILWKWVSSLKTFGHYYSPFTPEEHQLPLLTKLITKEIRGRETKRKRWTLNVRKVYI